MNRTIDQTTNNAIATSVLSRFPPATVDRLLCDAQLVTFPAGSLLYQEYDSPRVALIVKGLVRQYRTFPNGRQLTIWYHRSGDIIGIPLLIAGPWEMNVKVLIESSILIFVASTFQNCVKSDTTVCWSVAEHLCLSLYSTVGELCGNLSGSADRRIARHLLEVAEQSDDSLTLLANVTHHEIAEATGLARETVSRTLYEFRAGGLVKSNHGYVTILDPVGLDKIARPETH